MSNEDSTDLLGLAQRVAAGAANGEEVEAYVVRSRETDVQVFDGDVESLSVAGVEGVGVRVVSDHRQGFAWAGSLDPEVVDETLAEARDNASFGEPDEWNGLPSPSDFAGVEAPDLDLWRESLARRARRRQGRARARGRAATRAADARVRGVEFAGYGDTAVEAAVANSLGVEATTRRTMCSCASFAMAGEGERDPDRLRVLGRSHLRGPRRRRSRGRRGDARRRACSAHGSRRPGGSRSFSIRS